MSDNFVSLAQSRRQANERATARVFSDHGLSEEALAKAVREQKRKPKGDRMAVGE